MADLIDPDFILDAVRNAPTISYDTETTGLELKDYPIGYVVATFERSCYAPVRHGGGANIPDAEGFERALDAAFAVRDQRGFKTVGHNLAFDLKMSHKQGVRLNRQLEDTQINEVLIDDSAMSGYGLDDSAKRRGVTAKLGAELYVHLASLFGGVADRKQMSNFWRLAGDDSYGLDYACGDGTTTLELWRAQQLLLDEYDLRRVWEVECALIYRLAEMHRRGIKIDPDYGSKVMGQLNQSIKEAKDALPQGINVRSPLELAAAYNKLGITEFNKTAGGKPSFTEAWLSSNEFGRAILEVRRLEKARDSFITPLIDTHNINGRVHPQLNQLKGEDSGSIARLSCSLPNLQAFPKRNAAVGKVVRPLVVPDYGMLFEADFFQQEPHLFAHFSEDENLCRGYTSEPPIDLHDLARDITGRPRDDAKRLGMGLLTGLGMDELARRMGWTRNQAIEGANEYFGAFPGIKTFQKEAKKVAYNQGYVRTVLGRIARIPDPRFAYQAVSRIIQGSGADHMKYLLLRACEFCETQDDIDILISIHDSVMFQAVPNQKVVKELVRILEDCQSEPLNFIVPIPVELACGKNWGAASYGEKIRNPKKGGWLGEWRDAA
jgi:DNA polymerase I-like protein with 3'-5' exonuclease and polymerase domains